MKKNNELVKMAQGYEIITQANNDYFDMLDADALDLIRGGAVSCTRKYSSDDKGTSCGCGYKVNFESAQQ